MGFHLVGVKHFGEIFDLDQRLPCFSHDFPLVLPELAQSSRMRSTLSERDMSERITVSPSCNPSRIWIEFTDARPTFTGTRTAPLPSESSLKRLRVLFSCPNAGRPT